MSISESVTYLYLMGKESNWNQALSLSRCFFSAFALIGLALTCAHLQTLMESPLGLGRFIIYVVIYYIDFTAHHKKEKFLKNHLLQEEENLLVLQFCLIIYDLHRLKKNYLLFLI